MSRLYGEPVNVQARDDGRPVRFVWRGRLYTVRAILEHWIVNREWWQDPESTAPSGPERPQPAQPQPAQPQSDQPQPDQPQPDQPQSDQPQPERPEPAQPELAHPQLEFWRVEASPGPGMATGVYELRRDAAADAWTLRPGAS